MATSSPSRIIKSFKCVGKNSSVTEVNAGWMIEFFISYSPEDSIFFTASTHFQEFNQVFYKICTYNYLFRDKVDEA